MSIYVHNGFMNALQILEPAAGQSSDPALDPSCCEPSGASALSPAEAHLRAHIFKALADPNRLRLLSIVKGGGPEGACVCDLTEPLDLGQPTVSHHLKILVDAGLLHREKKGTWAYYSLVPDALDKTAGLLATL